MTPNTNKHTFPEKQGLYDPANEKDSCGVGFVAHIKGQPSHQIVLDADQILRNMNHRGACGCEPNTGDGAGILTGLPEVFLKKIAREEFDSELPDTGQFGAGIVFLPTDATERQHCKDVVERLISERGQRLVGWRTVPTRPDEADIGPTARAAAPHIEQLFIAAVRGIKATAFEQELYMVRK
ncbi:MAG: glutamate synthase subunit alpha, partial [Pirellulaceae bacterium]